MAIIYTYPNGPSPLIGEELIIISDPNNSNSTRNVTAQNVANLADINITFDPGTTGLNYSPNITQLTETVTLSGVLQEIHGGTGISAYTTGDMLYADALNSLSAIGIGAVGDVLTSNGTIPTWQTPAADINIYANDGTLTGNRTLYGDNFTLSLAFDELETFNVTTSADITFTPGSLVLALGAHSAGDVLTSNGSGIATWQSIPIQPAEDLATTLAAGNTTGANDISVDSGQRILFNEAFVGTLSSTTLTVGAKNWSLPDESGVLPVGPAWDTLIANPTVTENNYVITWNNTAGEYQLLSAGAGSGIYGGSGSLITDTIVTSANFDLSINEVSTVRPSIFNVVKGTIPPVKSQDTVAEYLWNGTASGSVDAKVINIANTVSSGASSTTGLNSTVSGLTGPKTAIKAAVVGSGPSPVGADIGLAVNIDNRAVNPSEPTTYGVYSSVLNNQATTTIAGYFSSLGFGGSTGYAIITNDGQIGFGTSTPDPSALLDISSTTQGFLPPRMTTAEMNAIGSPAEGLMMFDTTTKQWMGYNGTSWVILG